MSQTRFLRNVCYRKLLDKNAPISSYNLYEDDYHRFAFITFYNNSITTILSFKVKFTYFDENKNQISTAVFEVIPPDFYSHHNYTLSQPLVMPKEADGFNYEIFDLKKVSSKEVKNKNVKIYPLSSKDEHSYLKPKKNGNGKFGFVFPLVSLAVAVCGVIPYFVKGITVNSYLFNNSNNSNKYENGQTVTTDNGLILRYESEQFIVTGAIAGYSSEIFIYRDYDGIPITKMDSGVFSGQGWFQGVYFDNPNLTISSKAFSDCYGITYLQGEVKAIEKDAFRDCENLFSVKLNYCEYISLGAFYNCKSLKQAYVSASCDVDSEAFPSWTVVERI